MSFEKDITQEVFGVIFVETVEFIEITLQSTSFVKHRMTLH